MIVENARMGQADKTFEADIDLRMRLAARTIQRSPAFTPLQPPHEISLEITIGFFPSHAEAG
jgi:hypothetical protein